MATNYIDRNALIEHIRKDPLFDLVEQYGITGVIESFPAADVQPVLRCKDCKEWHRNYLAIDGGKHGCELFQDFTRPDDFCSFGTRMDGET